MAQVTNLDMTHYSFQSHPSGTVTVEHDGMKTSIRLTEDEAQRLQALAAEIYNARKHAFAEAIIKANPAPALEYQPPAPDTKYLDDEIPF